ncbi:MAG: hypothetical protein U0807_04285 [Candidatus Binatia bacterium]
MGLDHAQAAQYVGKESGTMQAPDKVSKSDIRHWCEVVGDPDPDYAEKITRGDKAAPGTMTMVWAMPPLWPPKQPVEPHEKLLALLDAAGYSGTAGLALAQEFAGLARIGDRLTFTVRTVGLSHGEEATPIGKGYVVDLDYTFRDGAGKILGTHRYKVLKFQKMELAS